MSTSDGLEQAMAALATGDAARASSLLERELAELGDDAPVALRSRATRAAATARRLAGQPDQALVLVDRALALAADPMNDDPVVAVEAELELGDCLRALDRPAEATAAYDRAVRLARNAGLPDLRRWQITLRVAGHELVTDAARGVERLEQLVAEIPDAPPGALDQLPEAPQALLRALGQLAAGNSDAALSDLRDAAEAARSEEDVAAYTGARIAIAKLLEDRGDRIGAYRSLATGWATLRAALGLDVAREAFLPMMRDCRERWGAEEFDRVKAAVEGRTG